MENVTRTGPRTRTAAPSDRAARVAGSSDRQSENMSLTDRLDAAGPVLRWAGKIAMLFLPVLLLTALAALVLYVRLAHGPISLKVLTGPIERGISAELGDLTAKIDDTVLRYAETGGFEVRLLNVRLLDADGGAVVSAPVAAVEISPDSFFALRVVPSRVELIEPHLAVSFSKGSGVSVNFTEATPGAGSAPSPAAKAVADAPAPLIPLNPGNPGTDAPKTGDAVTPVPPAELKRINVARALADYTSRARRGVDGSSSLKQISLRNATVALDYKGRLTEWKVPEFLLDLEHKKRRSVISGTAKIESDRGPWALSFRTEDAEKSDRISLKTSVRDFVPSAFGRAIPELAILQPLDMPVASDASLELSTDGDLRSAAFAVELGRGLIDFATKGYVPFLIDAGLVHVTYDAAASRVTMAPSTFRWGQSHVTLAGTLANSGDGAQPSAWAFNVQSTDGALAAEEFSLGPVKLDMLTAKGTVMADANRIDFTEVVARAGGADVALTGSMAGGRPGQSGVRIEGRMGPASADAVKVLWPRFAGAGARKWAGEHIQAATVSGGTVKFETGVFQLDPLIAQSAKNERMSLSVEATAVQMQPLESIPPIHAPRVLVRVENDVVEVSVPEAAIVTSTGKQVPLKAGQFTASALDDPKPLGVISFRAQSALGPVLEALKQSPAFSTQTADLPADAIDGKFDGQFKITVPLVAALNTSEIKVEGKGRAVDLKSKQKIGIVDLQSGSVDLDFAETGAVAKGELILNGVNAKLNWQRIFDAAPELQPPLTIAATLDNSDRNQLGIDINDHVDGDVPVEVTIGAAAGLGSAVKVRADLTNAGVSANEIAWTKPPGRPATLQFDIASGKTHKTELQNFKVTGDNVAIEGWVGLGADNKLKEFYFPDFSLNVVSRLELQGTRGPKNNWDIKARGSTFDGKDFFTSLFSLGNAANSKPKASKSQASMKLSAEIDNVLGHSGVALRGLKVQMNQEGDKLTALNVRGTLDGGQPLVAVLDPGGSRRILADTSDGGQAMRLVGFYPNMQGGRVRLELDLDGHGAAEKTGVLWADDFKILGDAVVSEVVSSAGGQGGPAINAAPPGQRKMVREVFEFDRMKVPFSVGFGQFVVGESYVNGPVMGATMRGKVDYASRRLNLGGTYVPLQGLNNVLGGIPVLGQIISGPRGEGIFGITFAIQGSMAQPQVVVNPLSMVAPGIFREIFQMTNSNPTVQPRAPAQAVVPVEQRTRNSSSNVEGGGAQRAQPATVGDSWSTSIDNAPADPVVTSRP